MIGWGGRFQVSGLSHQEAGTGDQVQVRVQEICPLSSIQSSFHSGWQVAAPGGRCRGFSIQSSVIDSALCPLSSTQHSSSVITLPLPLWPAIEGL